MNLSGLLKKKNNLTRSRPNRIGSNTFSNQTRESQILLKRINSRNRHKVSRSVVLRKKHGIFQKIIFLLGLLFILAFLVYNFDLIHYFDISFVNVAGAEHFVSSEGVKEIVERNYIGQSIFVIDEGDVHGVLSKNFLGAKNISVEKNFPNSIEIYIEERIPLAIVYNDESSSFLIDSEGYVLGAVDDTFSDLPKIKYEGPIIIGDFLEKDIIPVSIEILTFAEEDELKVSSMSFYPKYVKMFVGDSVEVFIGYGGDNKRSLRTVDALMKSSQNENKILKKIDLRYDKVIVLYE